MKHKYLSVMATIQKRQALRLKESLDDQLLALKNSEMWFDKLKKLEEYANLTIQDVTNEVNIRKKAFEPSTRLSNL